jgi:hypothetical protein
MKTDQPTADAPHFATSEEKVVMLDKMCQKLSAERDELRRANAELVAALREATQSIKNRGSRTWLGLTDPYALQSLDRWEALIARHAAAVAAAGEGKR